MNLYNHTVERSKKFIQIAFWGILLTGIVIRCIGLFTRPIWYDEAFALLISQKGPFAILEATLALEGGASADIHPPGYYFLIWGWVQVFGSSIVAGRLFSLVLSIGTMLFAYLLAKECFDDITALTGMLLVAILPFQVHYGVEIRMYSLLACLLTLATFVFWKGMNTQSWKWWGLFVVSAAAAQYTQNLAAFYLVPLACVGLLRKDWKTVRNTVLAGVGAILLYLPWLIQLPGQLVKIQQNYWVERPTIAKAFTLVLTFVTNLPLPDQLLAVGLTIAVLVILLAVAQTCFAVKQKSKDYEIGLLFFFLAFSPPLLLWSVSQVRPVYIERALLPAHVMFCLWIAWAFLQTEIPRFVQISIGVVLTFSSVLGIFQHVTYAGFPYAAYDVVGQYLAQQYEAGDLIVHSNKMSYLPLLYDSPDLPQTFVIDQPGSASDTLAPATREVLELSEFKSIDLAMESSSTIWLVIFEKAILEYQVKGIENHPHITALEGTYKLISSESFGEMLVMEFVK